MLTLHPIRKLCPLCGKPMRLVRSETAERERYVCPRCEGDPLHDATAQKWAAGPLKSPVDP